MEGGTLAHAGLTAFGPHNSSISTKQTVGLALAVEDSPYDNGEPLLERWFSEIFARARQATKREYWAFIERQKWLPAARHSGCSRIGMTVKTNPFRRDGSAALWTKPRRPGLVGTYFVQVSPIDESERDASLVYFSKAWTRIRTGRVRTDTWPTGWNGRRAGRWITRSKETLSRKRKIFHPGTKPNRKDDKRLHQCWRMLGGWDAQRYSPEYRLAGGAAGPHWANITASSCATSTVCAADPAPTLPPPRSIFAETYRNFFHPVKKRLAVYRDQTRTRPPLNRYGATVGHAPNR